MIVQVDVCSDSMGLFSAVGCDLMNEGWFFAAFVNDTRVIADIIISL